MTESRNEHQGGRPLDDMNDEPFAEADAKPLEEDQWAIGEIDRVLAERAVARGARAPRDLRQRVLDAAFGADPAERSEAIQIWRRWSPTDSASPTLQTVRVEDMAWEPIGIEGIRTKCLGVDPARRTVTMLVEMDAGSSYPPHRHGGAEECFVVRGDLRVGDQVLTDGDFQRADEGSIHGVQSTEHGCTLLIVSSQDDELIG